MSLSFVGRKFFQAYWRWKRGLTLGAQAVVLDGEGRVLLVRHGYRPGWHFPGGGVEKNELVHVAMARELFEETGVVSKGEPVLHGVYANFAAFPGDHVVLFRVNYWEQGQEPALGFEIAERGFFALDALPEGVTSAVERRLAEMFSGRPIEAHW